MSRLRYQRQTKKGRSKYIDGCAQNGCVATNNYLFTYQRQGTPTNRNRDKFCEEDLEILREHLRNGGHPIATVKDMDEIIAEGNYNKLMSERIGETPESVRKYGGNTVRGDRKRGADKDCSSTKRKYIKKNWRDIVGERHSPRKQGSPGSQEKRDKQRRTIYNNNSQKRGAYSKSITRNMNKVEKHKVFESSSSEEDDSDSDKTSKESNDNKQNSKENPKQNNNIRTSIEGEGEKIRRNSKKNCDEDSDTTEYSNKQKYNKNLQSAETRREDGRGYSDNKNKLNKDFEKKTSNNQDKDESGGGRTSTKSDHNDKEEKEETKKTEEKDEEDGSNKRCQPKCLMILEEYDPRYFQKDQILENAKCIVQNYRTEINTAYLKMAKVYYCKKYPDECNYLVCVNCAPVGGRRRRSN